MVGAAEAARLHEQFADDFSLLRRALERDGDAGRRVQARSLGDAHHAHLLSVSRRSSRHLRRTRPQPWS